MSHLFKLFQNKQINKSATKGMQSQHVSRKKKQLKTIKSATCVVFETILEKKTCAHLMRLAQDNGTFIKSRHQQHVICIQASKRTSFEQLFHLDYFTLVRTANSPRLLYLAPSWLVAGSFLGGMLVGGEMTGYRDKRSRQ